MLSWFRDGGSTKGDAVIAATAFVAITVALVVAQLGGWYPAWPAAYVVVAGLSAAAWIASRRLPLMTLVVVGIVVSMPWWEFPMIEVRVIPLLVAAYRAAAAGAAVAAVLPIVAVAGTLTLLHVEIGYALWALAAFGFDIALFGVADPSTKALLALLLAGVVGLGYSVHAQRRTAARLREQNATLVELQAAERERMAAELRTAIARDVHDVVAHHVSAMVIRAQAAERVAGDDPLALREAVRSVTIDGREALGAMREVVRMLRSDATPQPALLADFASTIDEMAQRVRSSGRTVEVVDALAPSNEFVQATLVRIVQEALTNVMLHSDAARVRVAFDTTDDEIAVSVEDDGSPPRVAARADGNGIRGMQERARAAGGRATAGPGPAGGWCVRVVLPRAATNAVSAP